MKTVVIKVDNGVAITREQRQELCEIYNESDVKTFLDYMYELLKYNNNPEMLEILNRVNTLNKETTLGFGREDYTDEEAKEFFESKWKLLNYFGIRNNYGYACIK